MIVEEAVVDPSHAEVAEVVPVERHEVAPRGASGCSEVAHGEGELDLDTPVRGEHVLEPRSDEVGLEVLVVVVRGAGEDAPVPVLVLVLEVVLEVKPPAGSHGEHAGATHVEDVATASAGGSLARSRGQRHERRREQGNAAVHGLSDPSVG